MDRRQWLQYSLAGTLGATLAGCHWESKPLLRLAAHPWPGYEFVYLARDLGMLDPNLVRLIETPAATANIRALGSQVIEASSLTLDEVLTTRARGIPLTIVGVLDISMGADVLMASPEIDSLAALKGRRVGVEHTATGALMLDAALRAGGLTPADIETVYVTVDEHFETFNAHQVDAIVTYEPVKSRLAAQGVKTLFSSDMIAGMVVDVIAVRTEVLESHAAGIREVLRGHFSALDAWRRDPEKYAANLAGRLNLAPDQVTQAFANLELPGLKENRTWFAGKTPRIVQSAINVGRSMAASGLLEREPALDNLADGRFLE